MKLSERQTAQRVAPIGGNRARRVEHKRALAEGGVRDGERL
jgi:hypothetical protein